MVLQTQESSRMNTAELQDIRIDCVGCGQPFVFSVSEQKFFQEKNYKNQPRRCRVCRKGPTTPNGAARESTQKGRVKWFDAARGFGFIASDDPRQRDVYVHHSQIVGGSSLVADQMVEFGRKDTLRGPQACNVTAVGGM
jgi:cold shock CspA family protein